MSDPASRYESLPTYRRETPEGGEHVLRQPRLPPTPVVDGSHTARPGERLDHIAARFFNDPYGWWRIADAHPGTEVDSLAKPGRRIRLPSTKRPS